MVGGDQRLGRRQVVVRRDQHLGLERVRHAGRSIIGAGNAFGERGTTLISA